MAIARVALGKMKDYTKITYGLTAPPQGLRQLPRRAARLRSRRSSPTTSTSIYDAQQQRLEYLVEFTL